MKKGFLINVEGIDGSGKSSLVHAIEKKLKEKNIDVIITKEPGGTTLGKHLRVLLHEEKEHVCDKAEFLLFAADRSQHFEQIVIPALEEGKIVISDRLDDSSVAYQGFGRGLDIPMIQQINRWAKKNIETDLTIFIKLDIKTALERVALRGGKLTSFETEKELFWNRVVEGFEAVFKSRSNVIFLNGKETIESLAEQATTHILKLTSGLNLPVEGS